MQEFTSAIISEKHYIYNPIKLKTYESCSKTIL